MRALVFVLGLTAVTGASARDLDTPNLYADGDAVTAQLVYHVGFGGEAGLPSARSFQLQIANEAQRAEGLVPLRAEYRFAADFAAGRFLVNGLDVEQTLVARQEEEGGLSALWGGWFPLLVVVGAAGLIIVDGQDQDVDGSGGS
jgi:hypothetical protein